MSKVTTYILHGWAIDPNNEQKWQPFMDSLSELGVKAKFLPIPGLSTSLDKVWTLDNYIQWLANELPTKQKVFLVGHSFGGQLSLKFCDQFPERVAGLVLIDSSGIRDQSVLARFKRTFFYGLAKIGKSILNSETLRKILYKLARASDYNQASGVMKKTMANVISVEVRDILHKIKQETLIIWGEDDKVTPLWMANYFNSHLPNSRLTVIPNTRHSPQFTQPKQVAQKVAKFIQES